MKRRRRGDPPQSAVEDGPLVVPGTVADVRGTGDSAVVEVRVSREDLLALRQGATVHLDTRPTWYIVVDDVGQFELRYRGDASRTFRGLFPDYPTDTGARELAELIATLLNDRGYRP